MFTHQNYGFGRSECNGVKTELIPKQYLTIGDILEEIGETPVLQLNKLVN